MKTPQIIVCILTVGAVILLWSLGSSGDLAVRIMQTFVIAIVGYMVATATKIRAAK